MVGSFPVGGSVNVHLTIFIDFEICLQTENLRLVKHDTSVDKQAETSSGPYHSLELLAMD